LPFGEGFVQATELDGLKGFRADVGYRVRF
jgi:hypothetical protein